MMGHLQIEASGGVTCRLEGACHSFSNGGVAFGGEGYDARSRTRYRGCGARLSGRVHGFLSAGNEGQAIGLVQCVGHGFAEQVQIAAAEGIRYHHRPADVVHRILYHNVIGQGRARLLGGKVKVWQDDRDGDGRVLA